MCVCVYVCKKAYARPFYVKPVTAASASEAYRYFGKEMIYAL